MKTSLTLCALTLITLAAVPVLAQEETAEETAPTEVDRRIEQLTERREELQAELEAVEKEIALLEEVRELVSKFSEIP